MVIIEPREGLCNRMRTLDAAIEYSRKIQRPLKVMWRMDARLNCPLSELFEYREDFGQVVEHRYFGHIARLRRRARIMGVQLARGVYLSQDRVTDFLHQQRSFEELRKYQAIYISTWDQFYPSNGFSRNFVPVAPLRSAIEARIGSGDGMVGVHIRRSDHGPSTERSPLWRFIELMQEEIALDSRVRFFLATDSQRDEATLKKQFPDRIISHPKPSLDRTKPDTIKDALIDLYCLARCRKLIGSYYSSFSDLAWKIGNIDKIIIDVQELQ